MDKKTDRDEKKSSIKDITPNKPGNSESKKSSENVEYKYSVNLSSSEKQPDATKDQSLPPKPDFKQSLEAIKNNPQALKAIKEALSITDAPPTKKDLAIQKTKKFTLDNLQKTLKSSLTALDLFVNYVAKKDGPDRNDVLQKARSPILFGFWVAFFTFIVAGVWSGIAPLDSSSHATGFVIPSAKKQVIQHKEGGIIEKIYVKEGDKVKAGDKLLQLSDKVLKSQIVAIRSQRNSLKKQLDLTSSQLEEMHKLFAEGFVQKDRLVQLQSREADIIGNLSELEARLINAEESFERLLVTAQISGTVNQIQFHTLGAVVPQGGTLMTITPDDDNLIIEAYVRPDDIDTVYVGLRAKIRISAFKHRSVSPLDGIVTHISSDVVEPSQYHQSQETPLLQQGGLQYKVKIEVDKNQLTKISKYRNYELHPGMMADVMIVTGERTVLQYLMDPITSTFWHAFIEK